MAQATSALGVDGSPQQKVGNPVLNKPLRRVERPELDWASRSLPREFELLIVVEVQIEEMLGSD